ncbi:MAG: TetR/AcrR family transcriptional regulator [Pseudomonadota bacterium]
MARPSLKEARRSEILSAYGVCVARYGVEGATLEKTAEIAGLARALIRHNVGNKEDLLAAFVDRFLDSATAGVDELFDELPQSDRLETLIDWLFDPEYFDPQEVRITNALWFAASERPRLATQLREWIDKFIGRIADEVERAHPQAPSQQRAAVANGIAAACFHVETMASVGASSGVHSELVRSAHLLASTL